MAKISKNIKAIHAKVDATQILELKEAIKLAKEASFAKFDESVELVFNLNLDTRKADQQLRGSVSLPNGTGKKISILAASDDVKQLEAAKEAGAEFAVDPQELEAILKKGEFNFDIIVATPKMMMTLGKFGKVLGPKGLMPNPKTGTVTPNLGKIVTELKAGKANYRTDKQGNVHTMIGKKSFDDSKLVENAETVIELIKKLKPSVVKGAYIKNIVVKTSMGASVKIKID
ncbi:50S ribosomal protein L1 [Mycoplasma marinum]|uniref:Large ribosomal subunit protein uL1 n=1 Tax=Mycoplasma marinum TaxID=1937190 RepID=A0A4R0XMD2_9MOLU|nr:50S ribosomal protein L1 [Mycoplasma marinum]